MAVPALVKVLLVFASLLIFYKAGLPLGLSLFAGAMGMALWFGHSLPEAAGIISRVTTGRDALLLLAVVWSILTLTILMNETGQMKRMIGVVRGIVPSRRAVLAILPAMIGFLPMPGGAVVSAPMVDAADEDGRVDATHKAALNFWFRHSWECWWPLYPAVLMTFDMARRMFGISMARFAAIMMPLTFFHVASGILFLLLPMKMGDRKPRPAGRVMDLAVTMLPIFILIAVWLLAGRLTIRFTDSHYVPMLGGIWAAIAWVHVRGGAGRTHWRGIVLNRRIYMLMFVVAGVLAFLEVLNTPLRDGGAIAALVHRNLIAMGAPQTAAVLIIPFIAGMVTGLAEGYVGLAFPLVLPLALEGGPGGSMARVVLAYGFGFAGIMLSPVHVCFILSNDYFKARLSRAYLKLAGPVCGFLAGVLIMAWVAMRTG